jgi:hypothetical protein
LDVEVREWQAPERVFKRGASTRSMKPIRFESRLQDVRIYSCPNGCDHDALLQFWVDHPGCSVDLINRFLQLAKDLQLETLRTDPVTLQRQAELEAEREAERREREAAYRRGLEEVAREEAAEERRRQRLTPEEREAEDARWRVDVVALFHQKHAQLRKRARS